MTEPKKDVLTVNVRKCSRCGGNHDGMQFTRFTMMQDDIPYTHWVMCPEVNEPIMLKIHSTVEGSA